MRFIAVDVDFFLVVFEIYLFVLHDIFHLVTKLVEHVFDMLVASLNDATDIAITETAFEQLIPPLWQHRKFPKRSFPLIAFLKR